MKEAIQALIRNLMLEADGLFLGQPKDWPMDQHRVASIRAAEKRETAVRLQEILRNWS